MTHDEQNRPLVGDPTGEHVFDSEAYPALARVRGYFNEESRTVSAYYLGDGPEAEGAC